MALFFNPLSHPLEELEIEVWKKKQQGGIILERKDTLIYDVTGILTLGPDHIFKNHPLYEKITFSNHLEKIIMARKEIQMVEIFFN